MRTWLLQLIVLTLFAMPAAAQVEPGSVDPTFVYPRPTTLMPDSTTAVQLPDGWLVIQSLPPTDGGPATLVLTRTDSNGRIDTGYGTQGRLTAALPQNVNLSTVARRLKGGSILLGGFRPPVDGDKGVAVLARLTPAGRFDPGFGIAGIATLDVPGDLDRVAAVGEAPLGPPVALLWSRTSDYPYDCQSDQATLLELGSDGNHPDIVFQRGRNDWTSESCRTQLTLQWSSQYFWMVGTEHGIFTPQDGYLLQGNWRYGPFAVDPAAGTFFSTINGSAIRIQRLGSEPGSGPEHAGLNKAVNFGADITWSRLVLDAGHERIYAGFVTDGGRVAIARFRFDGSLDTGWSGGIVAIEGAGRPGAWLPNGLASELRGLEVQPDGDIVVVTADGIMQRLKGGEGVARGRIVAIAPPSEVAEGRYTLPVVVRRVGGAMGAVSVDFEVISCDPVAGLPCTSNWGARNATAGEDFIAATGRLDWSDGDESDRVVNVQLLDDDVAEETEFFYLKLSIASGGTPTSATSAVIYITRNDGNLKNDGTPNPGADGKLPGGGGMAGAPLLLLLLLARAVRTRRQLTRVRAVVSLALLLVTAAASAAPGDPDPAWQYVQPDVLVPDSTNVVALASGYLVVTARNFADPTGTSTLELTRIDEDGRVVPAYGNGGRTTVSLPGAVNVATAAKALPGGAILLGGFRSLPGSFEDSFAVIARVDPEGHLDRSFGDGGIATIDVDGLLDRAVALDVVADGHILAAVWSRHPSGSGEGCSVNQGSLVRLDSSGNGVGVILTRAASYITDYSCRLPVTLQVTDDQRIYFGGLIGLFEFASPDALVGIGSAVEPIVDGAFTFACCVKSEQIGAEPRPAYLAATYSGPSLRYFGQDEKWSSMPGDWFGPLARIGSSAVPVSMVPDAAHTGWFVGIASESGSVALVKLRLDGSLDTGWYAGVGVAAVHYVPGGEAPDAGPSTDVRMVSVRPGGRTVVVATSDGIVRRLLAESGRAHGLIYLSAYTWGDGSGIESSGTLRMEVRRDGGADGAVSVEYSVDSTSCQANCAEAGKDYAASRGRLDWGPGDDGARVIEVPVFNDEEVEANERFFVRLANPGGGAQLLPPSLGEWQPSIAEIWIRDDDSQQKPSSPPSDGFGNSGGGGAAGVPLLLLLAACRRRQQRGRLPSAINARNAA